MLKEIRKKNKEEFEKKFTTENDFGGRDLMTFRIKDYDRNSVIKSPFQELADDILSFLSTAEDNIVKGVIEELKRMFGKLPMHIHDFETGSRDCPICTKGYYDDGYNQALDDLKEKLEEELEK